MILHDKSLFNYIRRFKKLVLTHFMYLWGCFIVILFDIRFEIELLLEICINVQLVAVKCTYYLVCKVN